jgi:hypothetical protein
MQSLRKMLTLAAAAAAIGMISVPVTATTSAEAGWKGKRYGHFHGHRWHGYRWHRRHFHAHYYYAPRCYWKFTRFGKVQVCPGSIHY